MKYYITNIHYGRGLGRKHIKYAEIRETKTNQLCINATFNYCLDWLAKESPNDYVQLTAFAQAFLRVVPKNDGTIHESLGLIDWK